jgi:hypothetical protein
LIAQLTTTIHSAAKPTWAPSVVVAMTSPDPTIEEARTMPGPMRRNAAAIDTGGDSTAPGESA